MFEAGDTPWLDQPVLLHSSRADDCDLTEEQCAFRSGYWRYWYESDHVYALSTIWLVIATLGVFIISHFLCQYAPNRLRRSHVWQRLMAVSRYFSYKAFRVPSSAYFTPSIGVMLLGAVGAVFFLAMTLGPKPYYWPNTDNVSYGSSPPIATRTGWMALALLPIVMALSAKPNLITAVTGISHEILQTFHHWVGYAMFVLALVHTFPFIVYHIQQGDMVAEWNTDLTYWTGLAALIPQAHLTFISIPFIRNRFYEFFKATHFLAALLFVLFFFFHCDFRLSSWDYFIATGAIYVVCLLAAQIRTYLIHGLHHATLDLIPGDLVRIKIPTTASWQPGQHIFLRFIPLGLHSLTAHPFTISSNPDGTGKANEMAFYIKPKGGVTSRLASEVAGSPGCSKMVLLDGPYGGLNAKFDGFDTVLMITGGSGAGFSLGVIDAIFRSSKEGDTQPRSIQIVFSTRHTGTAEWYDSQIDSILASSNRRDSIQVSKSIHVTFPQPPVVADIEKQPASTPAQISDQERLRPDIPAVISETTNGKRAKRIGIFACGPASMLHDARTAAATAQTNILYGDGGEIYLHTESFSA